jgi:hypothetical protein
MDIRVRPCQCVAAVLARAARARLRARTDETLPEPEGEALLAHTGRTVKQQRARESISANGIVEALAEQLVAMNGEQRHSGKLRGNTGPTNWMRHES